MDSFCSLRNEQIQLIHESLTKPVYFYIEYIDNTGYVAPELMTESRYNRKIDVFSLGVVLYNMVTECCLFTKGHKYYKMTQNEYYKYLKRKLKPIRKKTAIINLLYSCLTYDPDERLDVKKLLDRYFQSRR